MWPWYAGTLDTQKTFYLNQATQKNTCQIYLPKKIIWNPEYPPGVIDIIY